MPHFPKPFFKKRRGVWYVEINRSQINLGPDKDEAFRRYHDLMAHPQPQQVPSNSVLAIIDAFLEWCEKNRAPDTYRWYRDRLQEFARTIDPSLKVRELRPFHVQTWIDSHPGWADGSKRNGIRSIKRAMKWAEEQGYIDKDPIAHMKKPKAGKREVIVSEPAFDELLGFVRNRDLRDLLIVTWETGCRPQESLIVEARHVDLVNQRWVFQQSEAKGRTFLRIVYLTDEGLAITRRLMLVHPEGPLFRNTQGKPWTADSVNCALTSVQIRMGKTRLKPYTAPTDKRRKYVCIDDREVGKLVRTLKPRKQSGAKKTTAELRHEAAKKLTHKAAMKAAPKYSLYALRHTWMNRLLTSGVDALTVAILAGHQDPSTLAKVYQHLSLNPKHLLSQAKKAAS